MSQEDVEAVRRIYEAAPEVERFVRERGDLTAHPWLSLWHPEAVLKDLPEVPDASTYEGREAIDRYVETALRDAWEEWRFVPREITDGPAGVFVAVDNSARSRAGVELRMDLFQVLRVRDGMIAYAAGYLDRRQALEDAGLAE